ncbi:glycosyltransferase [Actinospongicola halichondriae]|uniref:glycosyltransferase n=1 Tax=Actinospongicola halichondriae TaxID=3236844 RepID=UPI003D389506
MLVSAALIVRDEAHTLDGCLASLRGLVDEIVVVDTGSVDDTVAIAQRHGARIGHEPWRDDFAHARNVALDLARGEWVLYIDADERIRSGDHDAARAALADDHDRLAALVRFVPRVGWTPYREYRLWRNRPDIRFTGAMHETIVPAVSAVAAAEALRVEPFDLVTIDHLGYEGDQRAKHRRDEPMLLAEIERLPHRSYLYDHLARVYEGQGRSDLAVETWQRGIAMTAERGTAEPDDFLLHVNLAFHLLAHRDAHDELGDVLAAALDRFDRTPSLELAAARHEFAIGEPAAALDRVRWILALTPDEVIGSGNSYDARIFGEWAHDLRGLCHFALGDMSAAAEAFAAAEALAPAVAVYGMRRRLAEARSAAETSSSP